MSSRKNISIADIAIHHRTRETSPLPRSHYYYIWTIGCQMNMSDSERLEAALQLIGYSPAARLEDAGLVIINSCSVRRSAELRVLGKLGELQQIKRMHPDTCIVLWGCMVDRHHHSPFESLLPMVDHFVAPSAVDEVIALTPNAHYRFDEPVLPIRDPHHPPVSAFVPIQYGCNMTCSYCIIPLRRGRERSRPLEEVVDEVRRIVALGTKEIILLGQIVDSWGHDLPGRPTLADLLRAVHDTPGLMRLRFLTSHPAWMTPELIETMASLPRCQPEINLPLQSGHDEMLHRMRRGYTVARYVGLVESLRAAIPNIAITTDIIVGHPGETREHFEQTRALVESLRFDKIHIAAFSARPGTLAAEQEQDSALAVSEEEKHLRRREIEKLHERIAREINATLQGTTVEVLVEAYARGKWRGRSPSNKLVFFRHPDDWHGKIAHVFLTQTSPWSLQGTLIDDIETATAWRPQQHYDKTG